MDPSSVVPSTVVPKILGLGQGRIVVTMNMSAGR